MCEARQQHTRMVEYWYDSEGSLVLKARLPALAGAQVVKALEAAMTAVPSTTVNEVAEQRTVSYAARRADALAQIAESYLQSESTESASADRYQVVVHVDAQTLQERTAGRCHIEQGPTLPAETVRRLTCDASVVRIVEDERGEPLDVGRKTRTIPPAIRRALNARDAGCCFPGCTFQRYLDAHHIEHWADGGATKLANLVTLCRMHHRLVHEGGITVEARAEGGWRFRRADGREFESLCRTPLPRYEEAALREAHAARGIEIDRSTAATRWRGERMDYELGVWVLCAQELRARDARARCALHEGGNDSSAGLGVSAETFLSRSR